jgi:hypothetical protein
LSAFAVALAFASAVQAEPPRATTAALEQSRGFCAARPLEPDTSVANAVNALGVEAPNTPTIAVLDTGVDPDTTELSGRVMPVLDAADGSLQGDVDGHGTQVAGMAAAAPGLVRGISPSSTILPIRVYNGQGASTAKVMAKGLRLAIDQHPGVIVIAGADPLANASTADLATLTHLTSEAFASGILVIAGSGNEGAQAGSVPSALPHVLSVGASDVTGLRATSSNTGPWVDLVAPGSSLTTPMPKTFCDSGYGLANGTSFAAGVVAGAAALLTQLRPELTVSQRFEVLRLSARDIGFPGRDDEYGYGLLDLGAAVAARAPVIPEASTEVDDDPFFVRGHFAAGHPVLLKKAKKARFAGQLSRAKDPADVYPVYARKGERVTVSVKAKSQDSVFELSFWDPKVGDFDVSDDSGKHRVVSTGGLATDPQLKMLVKKTGVYYVSVDAPDAVDEDDPTASVPVSEPYTLAATRTPAPKPKKKTKPKTKPKKG